MSAKTSYFQEDEIVGKVYDSRLMARLMNYIKPYSFAATIALILVIAGMGLFVVNPYILGKVVDEGVKVRNIEMIKKLTLIFFIIELLVFLFSYIQNYLLRYVGQKVMYDIRNELFSHIQRMPIAFFDKNPVGRLVTRTTNDVATLAELFSAGLVVVIGDVFLIVGIAVAMIALQPKLGFATLLTIPILIGIAAFFQTRFRDSYRNVRQRIARVNAALSENISGIKVIKIFNAELERASKFDNLNSSHRDAQLDSVFYHALLAPVVTVVNGLAIVIVLVLGGWMVANKEVSIGVLVSFIAYAQNFFYPIRDITEKIGIFQSAMASAERVFGLLDQPEESPIEVGKVLEKIEGRIAFEQVCFSYEPGEPVLKNISFEIKPGESVAIVGHTGAGKTTTTALLNRFYEVESGRITLDGYDIRDISKAFLRQNIVVIQQDVFIFSGTVMDNIRLWRDSISLEAIVKAAKETQVDDFIQNMPGGYDAKLHERGANISMGQRQLIAFARALCSDPKILVLDEATSSVDTETERAIQKAIEKLTYGRTCLIVAHRLSTIQKCNRVLVFHKGILVEAGTHNELLAKKGYYYRLHQLQFKDQENLN